MMMDPMGWGAGMMIAMTVFALLVFGAIVAGIVLLTRALSGGSERTGEPRAVEILEERFARGDIDREEYETRRHLLSRR